MPSSGEFEGAFSIVLWKENEREASNKPNPLKMKTQLYLDLL